MKEGTTNMLQDGTPKLLLPPKNCIVALLLNSLFYLLQYFLKQALCLLSFYL